MSEEQESVAEVYGLVGTPIDISGRGGWFCVQDGMVKTTWRQDPSKFRMEYVSTKASNEGTEDINQRLVAFRLENTSLYLSQNPYGEVAKAETLSSISALPILPEISSDIVEYAVAPENNFNSAIGEGEGYDYRPMQLEEGPPGLLQQFTLEGGLHFPSRYCGVGVKSVYGKYWRSPDWSDKVLQSPNHLGDEQFTFCRVSQSDET